MVIGAVADVLEHMPLGRKRRLADPGAAFAAHAGKASARAAVNVSPEPVSNMVVSTTEDVATVGLLALAIANPVAAVVIAAVLLVLSIVLIVVVGRAVRRFLRQTRKRPDPV